MIKQQWERLPHKNHRCSNFFLWKHTTLTPCRRDIGKRGTQGLIHPDNPQSLKQHAAHHLSGTDEAQPTAGLALVPRKRSPTEEQQYLLKPDRALN